MRFKDPEAGRELGRTADVGLSCAEPAIGDVLAQRAAEQEHILLDDADLRTRLGDGGRRRAEEHYSWAAVAAKTAAHYETVLAGHRRATEGTSSAHS